MVISFFEENIKKSFQKAKEHITELEKRILEQNNEFLSLNKKLELILTENKELKDKINDLIISSGNNGVKQINKQINKQAIKQISTLNITEINEKIEENFKKLTKQELKAFLSIYQLEEEKKEVSYIDVANVLGITESCIRIYIANLIKKGAPIIKTKINNKKVLLSIKPDFRSLNLKQKIANIYYHLDPDQKKLEY